MNSVTARGCTACEDAKKHVELRSWPACRSLTCSNATHCKAVARPCPQNSHRLRPCRCAELRLSHRATHGRAATLALARKHSQVRRCVCACSRGARTWYMRKKAPLFSGDSRTNSRS
eukprot:200159-Pleurochrysis_carterae.AAC.3